MNHIGEIYQSVIVSGSIDSKRVDALIDKKANVNVLNYDFAIKIYDKKFLDKQFEKKVSYIHFTNKIKIKGIFVYGGLIIKGIKEAFSFFITKEKFGTKVLVSIPALKKNGTRFDFVKDKIHFRRLSKRKGYWF